MEDGLAICPVCGRLRGEFVEQEEQHTKEPEMSTQKAE